MTTCLAGINSHDHCCYLGKYGVCRFLRDDGPQAERQFVCTFREKLGSWDKVHTDQEYLTMVRPKLDELGLPDCGDWPRPGEKCEECGVTGE